MSDIEASGRSIGFADFSTSPRLTPCPGCRSSARDWLHRIEGSTASGVLPSHVNMHGRVATLTTLELSPASEAVVFSGRG